MPALPPGHPETDRDLTDREWQVVRLAARGVDCQQMALLLRIAPYTVRKHRSNLLAKLGLHSTAQLSAYARRIFDTEADRQRRQTELSLLSPREREVMSLVDEGLTSKEIARRLALSPATVRKHRENATRRHDTGSDDASVY